MDRRTFLIQTTGTIVTASMPYLANTATLANRLDNAILSKQQWQTLAVVQEHLFPSESEAPGAKDINALTYLQFVLTDPQLDSADRELIIKGVIQLEKIAQYQENKAFIALSVEQRESLLRHFEKGKKGKQWIATILRYILEALLTDPIYGGNPEGIGWKWLDHQPGFPRPPANKRYFLL